MFAARAFDPFVRKHLERVGDDAARVARLDDVVDVSALAAAYGLANRST